ncbi:hypothetical protein ES702_00665 [subsurface metagenome]
MISAMQEFLWDNWINLPFDLNRPENFSFLQRSSTWLGESGKIVFLIFRDDDSAPFLIAKIVRNEGYNESVKKEFENLSYIQNQVSDDFRTTLPRPIKLATVADKLVYFEEAIPGRSLPFLWARSPFWAKRRVISQLMEKLSDWLWDFYSNIGIQEKKLTIEDIQMMFLVPLRTYEAKHILDSVEKEFLSKFEDSAGSLVGITLPLTGCHGDFWGGSILVGEGKVKVIDWEFFRMPRLPLYDLFTLAIHPGFSFGKVCGSTLFYEFKSCFRKNWFTDLSKVTINRLSQRLNLNTSILKLLFIMVLIQLSNERDSTENKIEMGNQWRTFLRFYMEHENECYLLNF